MSYRRKARECALQMLYQIDMTGDDPVRVRRDFWQENPVKPPIREFADRLVTGTVRQLEEIDRRIMAAAENWRFERMAHVDRNLLRMAVWEFLAEPETPRSVVINEAIEVAKKYGAAESPQFVNGVLDGVKRELETVAESERT